MSQDSSVYCLNCLEIECRWERDCPHPFRPNHGFTQPSLKRVMGFFPSEFSWPVRVKHILQKCNFSNNNYNGILWLKLPNGRDGTFHIIRSSPVERHWRHPFCTYAEYLPAALIRDSFWFFLLLKIKCFFFLSMSVCFCKYTAKHDPCSLTFRFQTPLCIMFYLSVVTTFSISSYISLLRKGSLLYRITPHFNFSILQCRLNIRCFLKLFPDCKLAVQTLLWIIMVIWRVSNPLLVFLSVVDDALCAKSKSQYSYEQVDSLNFNFIFVWRFNI